MPEESGYGTFFSIIYGEMLFKRNFAEKDWRKRAEPRWPWRRATPQGSLFQLPTRYKPTVQPQIKQIEIYNENRFQVILSVNVAFLINKRRAWKNNFDVYICEYLCAKVA